MVMRMHCLFNVRLVLCDEWAHRGRGGFGFKSTTEMAVRCLLADERLAEGQVFSLKALDESGKVHILNP